MLFRSDGKLTAAEKRLKNMDQVDHLIATDSERYMGILATMHPTLYKRYLSPPAEVKPEPVKEEPMPGPDVKFDDGSLGYSPERLKERDEWVMASAERRATARMEKLYNDRFGPIEQQWKADKLVAEKLPNIRAEIGRAREIWGEAFTTDEKLGEQSKILGYMREHGVSVGDAAAAVLTPLLRADRTKMREDILKEINTRPKAAVKAAPAQAKVVAEPGEARPLEEVIKEAMATLR